MDSCSSSSSEDEIQSFAMQLVHASVLPAVLKTAIELDLLELIKIAGTVSPAELAAQIPCTANPDAHVMLDRLLCFLAANNILKCSLRELPDGGGVERLYSLGPVCKFFTKDADGASMAPMFLMIQDKIFMESWFHLTDAVVKGGIPFNRAHEMSPFEFAAKDPRLNKIFNQAMSQPSTIIMKQVLEIYNGFEGFKSLVDVGGGIGASLSLILSKYPSIQGINFDLPHVIQQAPSYPGVALEHISGDMFVSVPRGDAIFIKWVCLNWSDEECLKLLKNCHEAIPENGKVIIADRILPEIPNEGLQAFTTDVKMLAFNKGGKVRTEKEFQSLAQGSGFKNFTKVCCAFGVWIMEFCK